jgi:hypothetical protein
LAVIPSAHPNFVPQNSDDWRKFEFDLSMYANQEVQIIFESVNRAGNHLYIDNFRIFENNNPPVGMEDFSMPEIVIFPNPSKEKFAFEINNVEFYQNVTLTILNIFGQKIEVVNLDSNRYLLDFSDKPAGVYLAAIEFEEQRLIYRIVKQ